MLIDQNNAKTASGVIPVALSIMLYGIIMCFGVHTGAAINLSIDFSGRVFAFCAGYGSEVFTYVSHWLIFIISCFMAIVQKSVFTFSSLWKLGKDLHLSVNKNATLDDIFNICYSVTMRVYDS